MLHLALHEPEIPPNTGNLIRLAANTGICLHLIKPLGFSIDDRQLKRAGLDYHQMAHTRLHENLADFVNAMSGKRLLAVETTGSVRYDRCRFQDEDVLLFGAETRGLPAALLASLPADRQLHIPMQQGNRSINLSNACAIVLFEALRQLDFPGYG